VEGQARLVPPLFVGYLWIVFGDAEAYFRAQRHWGRQLAWPWLAFETGMHNNGLAPFYRTLFNGSAIFSAVRLILALVMRTPLSWLALVVVWLVLFSSSLLLNALPRYLSIVVPYDPILAAAFGRWLEPVPRTGHFDYGHSLISGRLCHAPAPASHS